MLGKVGDDVPAANVAVETCHRKIGLADFGRDRLVDEFLGRLHDQNLFAVFGVMLGFFDDSVCLSGSGWPATAVNV